MEGRYIHGDDVYLDDYYMDEQWEPIRGFPNYSISDKGRVWSMSSQKFMKLKSMDDHGHLGVVLSRHGEKHYKYIHRLVADAFVPNPYNLPIVRHLDDHPDQNYKENLAWGTQKDNIYDAIRNKTAYRLSDEDREKSYSKSRTPVKVVDWDSREHIFEGQADAARELGLSQSNIWKVLNGERSHTKGYRFEYLNKEGI